MELHENMEMENDLLDSAEISQIINVAEGTLAVWRSTGRYDLPYIKVGRLVRYRRADIEAWLDRRKNVSSK